MKRLRNRALRKSVSVVLAALLVFSMMPAIAWAQSGSQDIKAAETSLTVQAVTPEKASEAVSKFADALTNIFADTSTLSEVSTFLTRFGGVTAAASGVIGVLQMSGIIKDPTKEALGQILDAVHDIQDQLKQIDAKLDNINQQLVSIAVRQEEKDRNGKATTMLKYWRDFNTQYCEPLDKRMDEYDAKIAVGIQSWWGQESHDGVNLLYTKLDDSSYTLTYKNAGYTADLAELPATADNGEKVDATRSLAVPSGCLPDTKSIAFNINTYNEQFVQKMAESFDNAADNRQLIAGDEFYSDWNGASESEQKQMASKYANDVLNTQIYRIACQVMSDSQNQEWVADVTSEYRNFCNNVLAKDSGVNAMLNAMYLTHGFEGEIKTDIQDFCDQMAVKAGVYGQFALTCVGQDDLQSLAKRQNVQTLFADTVISLYDKKKKALTGYDNYCYITGTKIEHGVIEAKAETTIKYRSGGTDAYTGYSSKDWTITVPSILDNVYSQVLYDQYRALNQGKTSFSSYLKAYGAFPTENWSGNIMTRYGGAQTFSLSEGIRMKATSVYAGESYFKSGSYYNIDVGTGGNVEWKYYHIHDKVLYDAFNLGTGTLAVDRVAAARAMYGESHWNWTTDEAWFFSTDGSRYANAWDNSSKDKWITEKYRARFDVLKLKPAHDLNGTVDVENPFFAFDAPSLTVGVSDRMEPIVQDKRTALTSVKLKRSTFAYTGKNAKPAVTVKAGKKTVPASGYTVSYVDNKKVGYATVTVRGKGKYSGSASVQFKIVPKGTKIAKAKKRGTSATVKWKRQSAKMSGKRVTGYQIRYSMKSSMKNAKSVKVKGYSKTTKKIKGLKKNKKYYFQVRTYMKGAKGVLYSKWSKKKLAK